MNRLQKFPQLYYAYTSAMCCNDIYNLLDATDSIMQEATVTSTMKYKYLEKDGKSISACFPTLFTISDLNNDSYKKLLKILSDCGLVEVNEGLVITEGEADDYTVSVIKNDSTIKNFILPKINKGDTYEL